MYTRPHSLFQQLQLFFLIKRQSNKLNSDHCLKGVLEDKQNMRYLQST